MQINPSPTFGMALHTITARDTDTHQYPLLTIQRIAQLGGAYSKTQTQIVRDKQTGESYTQINLTIDTPKLQSGKLSPLDKDIINFSCPPGHPSRRGKGNLVRHQIEMRRPGFLAWALGGKFKQVCELKPTDYEKSGSKTLSA